MITRRRPRSACAACYGSGMESLTRAQLDAMTPEQVAVRAREIHTSRARRTSGDNPLTEADEAELRAAESAVRAAAAALPTAEAARNLVVRRLRCLYPDARDLPSQMAYALRLERSMVHRMLRGSGYGAKGARPGLSA